jgi:TonB-dependent Receptor Plug Domain/TonB dependent receptor
VGHTHPVTHTHVVGARTITHTHPVEHTHIVAAPPPAPVIVEPKKPPVTTASETYVTGEQINARPVARPAEALEAAMPGLNVSQHSGEGKANQYQLRGFQLDHGTDLAITLDGMPLNMRTHGHGQGYMDANFLVPELISSVVGRKGPYFAEEGDFSSAGAVHVNYADRLDQGLFSVTGGSFGYGRMLAAKSYDNIYGGTVLGALETSIYSGPWVRPDEIRKINGLLRWSRGTQEDGLSITGMAYANRWFSTDQIPSRAVSAGIIPLWGNIDPTDGGDTTRFSLSGRWSQVEGNHSSRVEAFAIRSTLDLYNNFSYFLSNPDLGDQFHQFDHRTVVGLNAQHAIKYEVASLPTETRFGFQGRYDNIRVGIQDTWRRQAYDSVRNDYVNEGSLGFWTDTTVKWTPWLRTTGGARVDYFNAAVNSLQTLQDAPKMADGAGNLAIMNVGPFNSGSKGAAIFSPKAAIVLGPFYKTEMFLNYGEGFHSTDARGTVASFDTTALSDSGGFSPVGRIPLLVKSRGAEIGFRTRAIDNLESSISFWWLNLDSENQFNGDTGTTQFGRPSRRYGIELTNHYSPYYWLHFDGDVALTHSRFRGVDQQTALGWIDLLGPASIGYGTYLGNAPGNYIPEAPSIVASLGIEVGEKTGWFGGLKYKYKSETPLTEDGYLKGPAVGTLNLRVGYRWEGGWKVQADAFNVANSRSDQITYGYGSLLKTDALYAACLPGGAANLNAPNVCAIGVMDRHFHPVEPPAVRVTLSGPLPF